MCSVQRRGCDEACERRWVSKQERNNDECNTKTAIRASDESEGPRVQRGREWCPRKSEAKRLMKNEVPRG